MAAGFLIEEWQSQKSIIERSLSFLYVRRVREFTKDKDISYSDEERWVSELG